MAGVFFHISYSQICVCLFEEEFFRHIFALNLPPKEIKEIHLRFITIMILFELLKSRLIFFLSGKYDERKANQILI